MQILPGLTLLLVCSSAALAQQPVDKSQPAAERPPIAEPGSASMPRASGPIAVDGDLDDAAWKDALRLDTFYETRPADNEPAKVKTTAWATYDDRYLYVAFDCEDPEPKKIRAPYVDRDTVFGDQDFAGIILDTRNDGRTAMEFFVNPRGIQDDGITNDSSGNEDFSPDFFWDSVGKIGPRGWTLEIRIPLSTLRYPKADPQTWGILFYRNYPRDSRYQLFTSTLPRNGSCFVCRAMKLTGITGLPSGGHVVAAPYATAGVQQTPGEDGSGLETGDLETDAGLDVKWTPNADTIVDATVNPDFSQIESDVAQITANERFALFFPEKRPFFLEGVDLFDTPISAVYTRTITSPRWGLRGTGRLGGAAYTVLVSEDRGGGSVIVPGPLGSDFAPQDFRSTVAIGRLRFDLPKGSYAGFIATDREIEDGGYNRVAGPDFQWRPTENDQVSGQLLYSWTETPQRAALHPEWNGQRLSGHAIDTWWYHSHAKYDWFVQYRDFADEFRADDGFVPRVGYRQGIAEAARIFYPTRGIFNRLRFALLSDYIEDRPGDPMLERIYTYVNYQGKLNLSGTVGWFWDQERVGGRQLRRSYATYSVNLNPAGWFPRLGAFGQIGEQIDYAHARVGDGGSVNSNVTLRPTDHLELAALSNWRWLDIDAGDGRRGRLFMAQVSRLKATYTFTSRMYLRAIGQYVDTERDPALYDFAVPRRSGGLSLSALFAYKLNWQTVLFVGVGDEQALTENDTLERSSRQAFVKISYAFQR